MSPSPTVLPSLRDPVSVGVIRWQSASPTTAWTEMATHSCCSSLFCTAGIDCGMALAPKIRRTIIGVLTSLDRGVGIWTICGYTPRCWIRRRQLRAPFARITDCGSSCCRIISVPRQLKPRGTPGTPTTALEILVIMFLWSVGCRNDIACVTVTPPGRASHGLAFDWDRQYIWIFGGYNTYYPYLSTDGIGSGTSYYLLSW